MPKQRFQLAEETLGYITAPEKSNIDFRLLVDGSQNVLIDYQKKVSKRSGYTRLGAANTALTRVRNAWTWNTSTGPKRPQRFYDDELEVYLGTVDGVEVNAWTRVMNGLSTTEKLRHATIYDATENLDFQVMVNGDDNLYRWNGAVTTITSATSNTITKNGTETWAQARFYVNGNKVVNINGTEYTYTGGEGTTTLTGVTPNPSGEAANSVAIQKVVTDANKPEADRKNHTIFSWRNHLAIGSEESEEVFLSKNNAYTDFTFSSPRLSGEGALFTLTDITRGLTQLGESLIIFSGTSNVFKVELEQLDIGGTLSETVNVKPLNVGVDQGALCQEAILPVGDAVFYLTNEVTLRALDDPNNLTGVKPKTFSNPIKPDFDFVTWFDASDVPDAHMEWFKNTIYISVPQNNRLYMLNFVQDADSKLFRFWNPPQILPAGPLSIIDSGEGNDLSNGEKLHIHSNSVPESYLLFDGQSDGQYADMPVADKLSIKAVARYAFNNYDNRNMLKNFDLYYVEGEISPATTELELTLRYDNDGVTQTLVKTIDGSDDDILEGEVGINSLAQQSLGVNPLGGLLNPPSDARKFRVEFEIAKEDFFELQAEFATDDVDKFFSIISHGANATLSNRRPINIRK